MQNFYQNIYKLFSCTAGKCKESCCESWEVSLDRETLEKFKLLPAGSYMKIKKNIENDGDDKIFKSVGGRCPFLNEDNLCEIIIHSGEEYIPTTCKIYPRFIRNYGARNEYGLSLSCPEVVRLFCENEFKITQEITDEPPKLWDADAEKFLNLYNKRKKMLAAEKFNSEQVDLLPMLKFEYISDFIPNIIKNAGGKIRTADSSLILKIYKYFTFKYYLDGIFGEDMEQFINYCTGAVRELIEKSKENPEKIILEFSRETEHSEKNLEIIKQFCSK